MPFLAELLLEPLTQSPRETRRLPASRDRQNKISAANDRWHVEIAEFRFVFDIDQHTKRAGARGEREGTLLVEARHEKELEASQPFIVGIFGQQFRPYTGLNQKRGSPPERITLTD